ncbi:MAG: hypothetical protein KatS3mg035_1579 [Bacteroidia bacterium]|nr:MAG: hypothetical protein KatS3mg035_1579 [Bacteroidia bacterium]
MIFKIVHTYSALKQYPELHQFLDKCIKKYSNENLLVALKGWAFSQEKKETEAHAVWNSLLSKLTKEEDFLKVGNFLFKNKQFEWSEKFFLQGRKVLKSSQLFADALYENYIALEDYYKATLELMIMLCENYAQPDLIKSRIAVITNEKSYESIEKALLQSVTKYKDNVTVLEILFDFYVQSENYEEAFLQIKQIDRILQDGNNRMFQYAKTLQNNQKYEESNQVLDYIINRPQKSPLYLFALQEKAVNYEQIVLETKPVDIQKIKSAVKNYDDLIQAYGKQSQIFDAIYRKANLCIFYLNDLATALSDLESIENLPTLTPPNKAKAKLLIGDIFLLQNEMAKAELKYTEVEKSNKDAQIGALAKYKQAMLFYYRGDFEMAKAFFKILKDNTSNDISNDAIDMFLLIQDNTGLDTTTEALSRFAKAQLLIFQKQYPQALLALDSLQLKFPNHPLKDDILWQKAQITYNQGDIEKTLFFLDQILTHHSPGVYSDDALFLKAEMYDYVLKEPQKAIDLYLQIITEYHRLYL